MIHGELESKLKVKAPLIEINTFNSPPGGESFYFHTLDGVKLRIAVWNQSSSRGTVLLQSGRTEFIEKYYEVILEFIQRGFCVAMMDWRGQGLSERVAKDIHIGHIKNFSDYDSDFVEVIDKVYKDKCPKPWIGMGHSMGGCLIASAAAKNNDLFDAIILCAPMLSLQMTTVVKSTIYFLGLIAKIGFEEKAIAKPEWHIEKGWREQPFTENEVTSDQARHERTIMLIRRFEDLAIGGLSIGWLYEALKRIKEISSPGWIKKIKQPLLLLNASKDKLVNPMENQRICSQLENVIIENIESEHEILMEINSIRDQAWSVMDKFLAKTL